MGCLWLTIKNIACWALASVFSYVKEAMTEGPVATGAKVMAVTKDDEDFDDKPLEAMSARVDRLERRLCENQRRQPADVVARMADLEKGIDDVRVSSTPKGQS